MWAENNCCKKANRWKGAQVSFESKGRGKFQELSIGCAGDDSDVKETLSLGMDQKVTPCRFHMISWQLLTVVRPLRSRLVSFAARYFVHQCIVVHKGRSCGLFGTHSTLSFSTALSLQAVAQQVLRECYRKKVPWKQSEEYLQVMENISLSLGADSENDRRDSNIVYFLHRFRQGHRVSSYPSRTNECLAGCLGRSDKYSWFD